MKEPLPLPDWRPPPEIALAQDAIDFGKSLLQAKCDLSPSDFKKRTAHLGSALTAKFIYIATCHHLMDLNEICSNAEEIYNELTN